MKNKKVKKSKPKAKAKPKKKLRAKVRKAGKSPRKSKKAAPKAKAKKKTGQPKPKMSVIPPPNSALIGRVEDYFAHIGVIALTVKRPLKLGDRLNVLGHTTNLEMAVDSMQVDHQAVSEVRVGDAVGIKVASRARRGDYVFLLLA
jgi:hypothetical protein